MKFWGRKNKNLIFSIAHIPVVMYLKNRVWTLYIPRKNW